MARPRWRSPPLSVRPDAPLADGRDPLPPTRGVSPARAPVPADAPTRIRPWTGRRRILEPGSHSDRSVYRPWTGCGHWSTSSPVWPATQVTPTGTTSMIQKDRPWPMSVHGWLGSWSERCPTSRMWTVPSRSWRRGATRSVRAVVGRYPRPDSKHCLRLGPASAVHRHRPVVDGPGSPGPILPWAVVTVDAGRHVSHGAEVCPGQSQVRACRRSGASSEHYFQLAGTSDLSAGPHDLGALGQMEDRDAGQPLLESDPQLHARQIGTGTPVDT